MSVIPPDRFFYDAHALAVQMQDLARAGRGHPVAPRPALRELLFDGIESDWAPGSLRYRAAQAAGEAEAVAAQAATALLLDQQLYLGAAERPQHWSQLAYLLARPEHRVALARSGGQVLFATGTIGVGKSQALLTTIDRGLVPCPPLTSPTLPPTAAIVLHTDLSGINLPELVFAAAPNPRPADIDLLHRLGVAPAGLPRIRLLCHEKDLPEKVAALQHDFAGYPGASNVEVYPLRLSLGQLGMRGVEALLGVPPDRVPAYLLALTGVVQRLGPNLTCAALREGLNGLKHLDKGARARIDARLALLAELEHPSADLWQFVEPGTLTIIDLSGRWLRRQDVFPLAAALLNVLCQRSPRHGALQRLIALDEINRLAKDPALWEHLVMVARQARHLGLTLWLSGQDLLTVPDEMLGLATQVLCFRMANPQVYYDVQRRVAGLRGTSFQRASVLLPGQALWTAPVASVPQLCGAVHEVQFFPPACAHGGHTRVVF